MRKSRTFTYRNVYDMGTYLYEGILVCRTIKEVNWVVGTRSNTRHEGINYKIGDVTVVFVRNPDRKHHISKLPRIK